MDICFHAAQNSLVLWLISYHVFHSVVYKTQTLRHTHQQLTSLCWGWLGTKMCVTRERTWLIKESDDSPDQFPQNHCLWAHINMVQLDHRRQNFHHLLKSCCDSNGDDYYRRLRMLLAQLESSFSALPVELISSSAISTCAIKSFPRDVT